MSSTQFVEMYHPLIPSTITSPVRVAMQAVDDRAAKGWLLVDPDGVLPTPDTPYYTKEALLSQIQGGAAPIGAALRAALVAQTATVDNLPAGAVLAHRGAGANLAPENTKEAFLLGLAFDTGIIDGGDIWLSADGVPICMHDGTVDGITTDSGNIADFSANALTSMVVDAGSWFGGNRYGNMTSQIVTFDWLCAVLGRRTVLTPEIKDPNAVAAVAAVINRQGVHKSIIMQSFTPAALAAFRTACPGVQTCLLINAGANSTWTPQQVIDAGHEWVGLDYTWAIDQQFTDFMAAGLKVMGYTVTRQYQHDRLSALGVDVIVSDDPLYSSRNYAKYRRTSDPFKSQTWSHGMVPFDASRTIGHGFVAPNRLRQQPTISSSMLMGTMSPIAAAADTYSLAASVTAGVIGTDVTRWAGIFFAAPTDHAYNDAGVVTDNGYLAMLRANGELKLWRRINGVVLAGPTVSTAALTAGGTAQLKIDVTPTGLTLTRVDTAQSITWADTTHRGGYFHLFKNGTSGLEVDWSAIAVS